MNENLPLIVANLKANKSWEEILDWIKNVGPKCAEFSGTVVLCPSHPFLMKALEEISSGGYKIKVGSQDVSKFEQGPYTGEVAASQIKSICQYTIVGHSERRRNLNETEVVIKAKIANATKANIIPILCVQADETLIYPEAIIVAYEPIFAIGTGNPDTPENAINIAKKLKAKGAETVLYGGSVTPENVKSFLKEGIVNGFIVGTSSQDPQVFAKLLESVQN